MVPVETMPLVGAPPPSHHLLQFAHEVMTNTPGPATAVAAAAAAAPSLSTESAEEAAVAGLGIFAPPPAAAGTAPAKPPTVLSQGLNFVPVGGEGAGGRSPRLSFHPVGRKRKPLSSSSDGGERAVRASKSGGGGSAKPQPSMRFIAELLKSSATIAYARSNPKREGTDSHARYEGYKAATTCEQALELGARRADLQFDLARGYFTIEGDKDGVDWSVRLADELARVAATSQAAATAARAADGDADDDNDVPGLAPVASAATTVDNDGDDDDDDDGMAAAAAARAALGAQDSSNPSV